MATHNLPDFDTLSVSLKVDKKDLEQKYRKRVDNWTSFFDKWSSLDDSEDKELELEKDGDWNLRVGKIPDENCDDSNSFDEYSGDDEDEDEESEMEEDAIEILDDTQTIDQTFASLTEEQFLTMKRSVLDVQQAIVIPVAGIDFETDTKCAKCNGRTYLPKQYFEFDERALCNDCLVADSGHGDCAVNLCNICIKISEEIRSRDEICDLFEKGLLLWQS